MQPYGNTPPDDALPGGHVLLPVLAHAEPAIAIPWGEESGGGRRIAAKEPQVADETAPTVACAPAPRLDGGASSAAVEAPPRESAACTHHVTGDSK